MLHLLVDSANVSFSRVVCINILDFFGYLKNPYEIRKQMF